MIDTLILKYHGLKDLNLDRNQTTAEKVAVYSSDVKEFLRYPDSGNYISMLRVQKLQEHSYGYEAACFVDQQNDCLTINFSLPKFQYSTNVLQLIDHNKLGDIAGCSVEYQLAGLYHRFISVVKHAFFHWFSRDIDLSRAEITRIDFCFNAFFNSVESLDLYYDALRDIKKKFARISGTNYSPWETSLNFVTDSHSFKVYKKGPEYKKHDGKAHKALNKRLGRSVIDTDRVFDFAGKILRYEVTGRNAWLSSRYVKILKASRPGLWNINKEDVKKYSRRTFRFFLKADPLDLAINSLAPTIKEHSFRAEFSEELLISCFLSFWEYVKQFQVTVMTYPEMLFMIEKYNDGLTKGRIPIAFNMFCKMVADGNSIDLIKQMDFFPLRTFYRYKKIFLKLFGKNVSNTTIFTPLLDYSEYQKLLMAYFGSYKIFKNG